jgi:hypothetical protein
MTWGNKPVDGGFLILNNSEKDELLRKELMIKNYILPLISAKEYLHRINRWCIWLVDTPPTEIKKMPILMQRIDSVRALRLKSPDIGARKLAEFPSLFRDKQNPAIVREEYRVC